MQPNPIKNLIFSLIRTVVPAVVTLGIGWATENFGAVISEDSKAQLVALAYTGAFGIYYLLSRLLETYVSPKFSFLVGDFRKGHTEPVYADQTDTTVVPPAEQAKP